jgi:ABC-type sugar transport system substrate-binding protein
MVFYGFTQSMLVGLGAGMGGAVGGALLGSTTLGRKPPADLGIAASLTSAFAAELRAGGRFTVVQNGPADAELKLTVKEYGFFQAGVMRRGVKPILNVRAQLVRRDGKVVWDQTRFLNQMSKSTHAQLPERMKRDPELAVQELRTAARVLVADLARSLQQ